MIIFDKFVRLVHLKIIFIMFFLLIEELIFCQGSINLLGHVYNKFNNNPVKSVNIKIHDSNFGTSTNQYGFFSLSHLKKNTLLIFSHLGFETLKMKIDTINYLSPVNIFLKPTSTSLEEVIIPSRKKLISNYNQIIDYNFIYNNVLILYKINNKKKFEVALQRNLYDTVAKLYLPHYYHLVKLFRDCFGNMHLVGKDSVYQIEFSNNKILITYVYEKNKFMSIMTKCILSTKNYLVLKNDSKNKYYTEYYSVSKTNKTRKTFITQNETKKEKEIYEYLKWLIKNGFKGDIEARIRFEKEIMNPPSFQPIIKFNNEFFYMNHVNHKIVVYDLNLNVINCIYTDYSSRKGWKPVFLVDDVKKNIYTVFRKNGSYYVSNINLSTGKIDFEKKIPIPFPEKPKINDGYFYCIVYDFSLNKKRIFRVLLN